MRFFVPGIPVAQGSKRHVGGGVMVEMGKGLRPWRDSVIYHARQHSVDAAGPIVFNGPVAVALDFYFPRPKSHFGTGRNAGLEKDSAPTYKSSAPDLDKLVRAILDSLTMAGVLRDDALVASIAAVKRYDPQPGVHVAIRSI